MWDLGMSAGDRAFEKVDGQDLGCRVVPDTLTPDLLTMMSVFNVDFMLEIEVKLRIGLDNSVSMTVRSAGRMRKGDGILHISSSTVAEDNAQCNVPFIPTVR
jgi:hypothetical protein